jgi:hypothetical protein
VGARVTGIGALSPQHLDGELRHLLDGYEHVATPTDAAELAAAVRAIQERGPWVDRLETVSEPLLQAVADAREATSIPGESSERVRVTRDKWACRRALARAGVHTVPDAPVTTEASALAFAREHGYPLIFKPRVAQGQADIEKIDDEAALRRAVATVTDPDSHVIERFADGHEGFFDSLVVEGEVVFEAVTHFYPSVLEAMRNRAVSPMMVHTNRLQQDGYDELREFNRTALRALGVRTSATHLEWYSGSAGRWVAEVGLHPPPCRMWDLFAEGAERDLHAEWARAIAWSSAEPALGATRFATGLVNLRPERDGIVVGYDGVEVMQRRYGARILRMHLPPPGTFTQPVEQGYLANAWVAVKHPDYDELRRILADIGETVRVHATSLLE